MIGLLKRMMGMTPQVDIADLLNNGTTIVDVRSKVEYNSGHIKGSVNIPLENIKQHMKQLKSKEQPIVTCCVSGRRSGIAKDYLKQQGYTNVHNGGPWQQVRQMAKK
jgi:phage shock protein E